MLIPADFLTAKPRAATCISMVAPVPEDGMGSSGHCYHVRARLQVQYLGHVSPKVPRDHESALCGPAQILRAVAVVVQQRRDKRPTGPLQEQ